jgi:hypothetical protein
MSKTGARWYVPYGQLCGRDGLILHSALVLRGATCDHAEGAYLWCAASKNTSLTGDSMNRLVSAFLRISPYANPPFAFCVSYLSKRSGVTGPTFYDVQ